MRQNEIWQINFNGVSNVVGDGAYKYAVRPRFQIPMLVGLDLEARNAADHPVSEIQ